MIVRPEGLALFEVVREGALEGKIVERQFAGESTFYQVDLAIGGQVWVRDRQDAGQVGDHIWVGLESLWPAPIIYRVDPDQNP